MIRDVRFNVVLMVSLAIVLIGCQHESPVVLLDEHGAPKLIYDAGEFHPQAKTAEDIRILARYIREVVKDLRTQNNFVALASLSAAMERQDFGAIERIIYENQKNKCQNNK